MNTRRFFACAASVLWLIFAPAASAEWRISVKLILGPGAEMPAYGNPNAGNAFNNVASTIEQLNTWLQVFDTPYQFDLIEVLAVPGLEAYFDAEVGQETRNELEANALADPALYGWRDDAINVYINGNNDGTFVGYCSIASQGHHVILLREDVSDSTVFHELGHYFDLFHTHQDSNYVAGGDCDGPQVPGNGDFCDDTLPDHRCFGHNAIATNYYTADYEDLLPSQQELVDNTWDNLMSYHHAGVVVTEDQWARVADASEGTRANVSGPRDWFVDLNNGCGNPSGGPRCAYTGYSWLGFLQSGAGPYPSVAEALGSAANGDRLRIRPGTYPESLTIDQAVTLTADGGPAILR